MPVFFILLPNLLCKIEIPSKTNVFDGIIVFFCTAPTQSPPPDVLRCSNLPQNRTVHLNCAVYNM